MTATRTARQVVAAVPDPEIPVLSIEDLGILRDVTVGADGVVQVTITPTYSGCPAMDAIRDDVVAALHEAGFAEVQVETVLSPAWTTEWLSDEAPHGFASDLARRRPNGWRRTAGRRAG